MPRKLSRGTRLLTTAGIAAVAALAAPAAASAAECPVVPTTAAFAAYGDANDYFAAPGGTFESFGNWSLRGTPDLIGGFNLLEPASISRAAGLRSGEGVTSVSFCVDRTMPHLRFNAKYDGGGQLDVTVTTRYDGGSDSSGGSISPDAHRGWAPSRAVELKTDSIPAGEQGVATVSFRSQGYWRVDDVAIDPYRR
jgi:opacity protein-like surface antigen